MIEDENGAREETPEERHGPGLSSKLLVLTIAFVMLAEVLIYVPSVANYRKTWLEERLAAARTAVSVVTQLPAGSVSQDLVAEMLDQVGAMVVAVRTEGGRRLIAAEDTSMEVARHYDLREDGPLTLIGDAFETLLFGGGRYVRVVGVPPGRGDFLELVVDDTELRQGMLDYSVNILILSLIISGITAALVYISLRALIVRPVQRLSRAMEWFAEDPEDPGRIIAPSARNDEIGVAQLRLAALQRELNRLIAQKSRLAGLGLAVSKINHDLRNLLAAAQINVDRVGEIDDPTVQRFVPRLIATLDRAVAFCTNTLKYGSAAEAPPERLPFLLGHLMEEVRATLGLDDGGDIRFVNAVDPELKIDADHDQLFRVMMNLCRNAVEAFESEDDDESAVDPPTLSVSARRESGRVIIDVADNGPGVPERARARLFEAFRGSARPGGTGLGLAIAAELVRAHGGTIDLLDSDLGATFSISIPDAGAHQPSNGNGNGRANAGLRA